MTKLDPRMEERLITTREKGGEDALRGQRVGVFVEYTGDPDRLKERGLEIHSVDEEMATGIIDLADVESLAGLDNVSYITLERFYRPQLKDSVSDILADNVHSSAAPPTYTGKGVIIGIIDSGIDHERQSFRKPNGDTRILALWDQTLTPNSQESSPSSFNYGVEYTESFINQNMNQVRQKDTIGHGTHVAGIAAGDGSQPGVCRRADTFVGVAPQADLIIVKGLTEDGISNKSMKEGLDYILQKADAMGKPVVVNMSLGGTLGPHDGTDLAERHIDKLLFSPTPSRAVVIAAGNQAEEATHAARHVVANGTTVFTFEMPADNMEQEIFEIWYGGQARLQVTLQPPGGNPTPSVSANRSQTQTVSNHRIHIDSRINTPHNLRHQIYCSITPPANSQIAPGQWIVTLTETTGNSGTDVDFWIDQDYPHPEFLQADRVVKTSVTEPGTTWNALTVGAYSPDTGLLADFSSRGPTADGRIKPEITAPGVGIISMRSSETGIVYCSDCCLDSYMPMNGTSMAAPHVAGVMALMFEKNPSLHHNQLREIILETARPPGVNTSDLSLLEFSAGSSFEQDLNQGNDSKIRQEFQNHGISLSGNLSIEEVISGRRWWVTDDKDRRYTVIKENSQLKVYDLPNNKWGYGKLDALRAVENTPSPGGNGGGGGGGGGGGLPAPMVARFAPVPTLQPPQPLRAGLQQVQQALLATPAGHLIAGLISTHFDEVFRLIQTNRRVATLWHRSQGPALVRRLLTQGLEGEIVIAEIVGDRPLADQMDRFLALLARYGSPALQTDIARYGPLFTGAAGNSLQDLEGSHIPDSPTSPTEPVPRQKNVSL